VYPAVLMKTFLFVSEEYQSQIHWPLEGL